MSWMVTQLYSDVASRPTRGRSLSVTRLQSVGAGSGLETNRSALPGAAKGRAGCAALRVGPKLPSALESTCLDIMHYTM